MVECNSGLPSYYPLLLFFWAINANSPDVFCFSRYLDSVPIAMASLAAASKLSSARTVIRFRCVNALRPLLGFHQTRGISTSWLKKVAEGQERWDKRAEKIQSGELPHVWDILQERGYIKDVAGYAALRKLQRFNQG